MKTWIRWWRTCLVVVALVGGAVQAQAQAPAPTFKAEELEALVAPIALYPDSLLSQVLMASTYPLEVVHAARWLQGNRGLKGESAVKAVQDKTWDASVKSLVAFPQVLEPMNDKLDWTQKLGDAFLAQPKDVMGAVQRLREKARQNGKLASSEQQKVIVEPPAAGETTSIVRIEPADPQVIYVPTYDPAVVYGSWMYPTYPPYYWPPYGAYYPYYPGGAFASGIAWGIGFAMAGAIFGDCDWGGGSVNIDIDRVTHFDRNFDRNKAQGGRWQHDVSHRQGVAYRDNATREKYTRNGGGADGRQDFRGREGGVADRSRTGGAGDRPAVSDRAGGGAGDRAGAADRAAPAGPRDNAFQGVGNGAGAQRDFDRGSASTQPRMDRSGAAGAGRMSGGGARFSGGGGRGGGRR